MLDRKKYTKFDVISKEFFMEDSFGRDFYLIKANTEEEMIDYDRIEEFKKAGGKIKKTIQKTQYFIVDDNGNEDIQVKVIRKDRVFKSNKWIYEEVSLPQSISKAEYRNPDIKLYPIFNPSTILNDDNDVITFQVLIYVR